jgi:NitT/TauT family transport system ATP-binding protein
LSLLKPPLISTKGITKSFPRKGETGNADGKSKVLGGVTFDLQSGSFTSIIGPSGCGKTTLLRIIDGLIRPDSGEVVFNGNPVTSPPPKMGFVFQQFGLLPWRTIQKNVELGLELRGVDSEEREAVAQKYIAVVGLKGFEHHYVHEISAGMQQRVGLARALSIDPDVLLMDEPFASIDEQTREILQKQLLQIVKGTSPTKTTLFVTHNVDEAIYLSDEIVLMGACPAKVKEVVRVDLPPQRWRYDIRSAPEYVMLWRKIWRFLENEIMHSEGFGTPAPGIDIAGNVELNPIPNETQANRG